MKRFLNLICAVLYAATGILWIVNALRDDSVFDLFLALVWLIGAVIWVLRVHKERKESLKENDNDGETHSSG